MNKLFDASILLAKFVLGWKRKEKITLPLYVGIVLQIPWIDIIAWMCANWLSTRWSCHIRYIWKCIDSRPIKWVVFISCQRFYARWTGLIRHLLMLLKVNYGFQKIKKKLQNNYSDQNECLMKKNPFLLWIMKMHSC